MEGDEKVYIFFSHLTEEQLQARVGENSDRLNGYTDLCGYKALQVAAKCSQFSPALLIWLIEDKGVDVNEKGNSGGTALLTAESLEKLDILLTNGADPTLADQYSSTPLMQQAKELRVDCVRRLLEFDRVRESVNAIGNYNTMSALQHASDAYCHRDENSNRAQIIDLLLQAGADASTKNKDGKTALDLVRNRAPTDRASAALLDSHYRIHHLSKARRHIEDLNFLAKVATDAEKISQDKYAACLASAPVYLKERVAADARLPQVHLFNNTYSNDRPWKRRPGRVEEEEEAMRRATVAYVLQADGAKDTGGMPPDVFHELMLMMPRPRWNELNQVHGPASIVQLPSTGGDDGRASAAAGTLAAAASGGGTVSACTYGYLFFAESDDSDEDDEWN